MNSFIYRTIPRFSFIGKKRKTIEEAWGEVEDHLHEVLKNLEIDKGGPIYIGCPFEEGYLAGFLGKLNVSSLPKGWELYEISEGEYVFLEMEEDRENTLFLLKEEALKKGVSLLDPPFDVAYGGKAYLAYPLSSPRNC